MTMTFLPFLPVAYVQFFLDSNLFGQIIVVLLILGSVVGWTAMVFRFAAYNHVRRAARRFYDAFDHEEHPLGLFMRGQRFHDCPPFRVYLRACESSARLLGLEKADPRVLNGELRLTPMQVGVIREAAERELADQVMELETDMPIIATVTTAAPFLGLLGTVAGVMEAFSGMAQSGDASLTAVAPGISAALLTTVAGLVVAIPTLIGYNLLNMRLREHTVAMDNFVQKLSGEMHFACVEER